MNRKSFTRPVHASLLEAGGDVFEEPELVGDAGAADVDSDVPDAPHPHLRKQPRPGQTC